MPLFLKIILIVLASLVGLFLLLVAGTFLYLSNGGLQKIFAKRMFAKRDEWKTKGYEKGNILLVGSSFMENWKTSAEDLAPLTTYNSAVGGTRVEDWDIHVDDMIVPFDPKAVVIYVGSNNIHGGKGSEKGDAVAEKVIKLLDKIHSKLPGAQIYYVSISPSPKRNNVWHESNACNTLVAQYSSSVPYLTFIDCTPALLNEDGSLRTEIYGKDALHYNEKGYVIWKAVIKPVLEKDFLLPTENTLQ